MRAEQTEIWETPGISVLDGVAPRVPDGFEVRIDLNGDVRVAANGTSIWLQESDDFNHVAARLIRALLAAAPSPPATDSVENVK